MSATFDFGMIVFNAEFLLGPCIKHVYEFAHRILIVEGATKAATHTWDGDTQWITSDGHSTDGTVELVKSFPDPDKKIVFIQRDGFWDGKTEMCNAYVPYVEADYVWQLDADEFYQQRGLLAIRNRLTTNPEITAVHFFANHFWGDWNHVACGRSPKVSEGYWGNDIPWQRVFKHEEGSRWASHEPPVYLAGDGGDQSRKRLLSRYDTRAMGIGLYHYSYVTREQAEFKSRFFGNPRKLADWNAWQTDHSREIVVPGTFACEFKGEHPEVIREFISRHESRGARTCADVHDAGRAPRIPEAREAGLRSPDERLGLKTAITRRVPPRLSNALRRAFPRSPTPEAAAAKDGSPPSCLTPATKLFVSADRQIVFGPEAEALLQQSNDLKYLTEDGVVRIDRERWEEAQAYERGTWMSDQVEACDDRNMEHAERFKSYEPLKGRRLSRVIELGCGPFTNARLILPRLAQCTHLTLLDPLVDSYLGHPNCTYASGELSGVPVTTVASSIEDFEPARTYDLLILVNVLEHCFNVPRVFDVITATLRPGGILVFAECILRPEDLPRVVENWYDTGHPIRLSADYVTAFLHGSFRTLSEEVYEGLYSQTNRKDLYFIGERV